MDNNEAVLKIESERERYLLVEVKAGATIGHAARCASLLAHNRRKEVWFDFNGTECKAKPGEPVEDIVERYEFGWPVRLRAAMGIVGPKICDTGRADALKALVAAVGSFRMHDGRCEVVSPAGNWITIDTPIGRVEFNAPRDPMTTTNPAWNVEVTAPPPGVLVIENLSPCGHGPGGVNAAHVLGQDFGAFELTDESGLPTGRSKLDDVSAERMRVIERAKERYLSRIRKLREWPSCSRGMGRPLDVTFSAIDRGDSVTVIPRLVCRHCPSDWERAGAELTRILHDGKPAVLDGGTTFRNIVATDSQVHMGDLSPNHQDVPSKPTWMTWATRTPYKNGGGCVSEACFDVVRGLHGDRPARIRMTREQWAEANVNSIGGIPIVPRDGDGPTITCEVMVNTGADR